MSSIKSDDFTVGPVVLSYVGGLFESRAFSDADDSQATYSAVIIFGDDVRRTLDQHVDHVGNQAFPTEWRIPNRCHRPIRSIEEKPQYVQQSDKLGGARWFANVKSRFQP